MTVQEEALSFIEQAIQKVERLRGEVAHSNPRGRLYSLAITELETAELWLKKAEQ